MVSMPSLVVGIVGILVGIVPIIALSTEYGSVLYAIFGAALAAVLYISYFVYRFHHRPLNLTKSTYTIQRGWSPH